MLRIVARNGDLTQRTFEFALRLLQKGLEAWAIRCYNDYLKCECHDTG